MVCQRAQTKDVDGDLVNGGTRFTERGKMILGMLTNKMTGFWALFRMLSDQEGVGSAVILSRVTARTVEQSAVLQHLESSVAIKLAINTLTLIKLFRIVPKTQNILNCKCLNL